MAKKIDRARRFANNFLLKHGFDISEDDAETFAKSILQFEQSVIKQALKDRNNKCVVCKGRGFNVDWNKNKVTCSTCKGKGYIIDQPVKVCPVCRGEKYIQTKTRGLINCRSCNGTGRQ